MRFLLWPHNQSADLYVPEFCNNIGPLQSIKRLSLIPEADSSPGRGRNSPELIATSAVKGEAAAPCLSLMRTHDPVLLFEAVFHSTMAAGLRGWSEHSRSNARLCHSL